MPTVPMNVVEAIVRGVRLTTEDELRKCDGLSLIAR